MISRRVPGAFYRVCTLEGVGVLYFNTARHGLLKTYVDALKLGLASALYRPMPQMVGHSTKSFKLNYYYSFYFNTARHVLLKAFGVRLCLFLWPCSLAVPVLIDGELH